LIFLFYYHTLGRSWERQIGNAPEIALGQAVAVSVWNVAMGLFMHEESRAAIQKINEQVCSQFGSCEEFGRSYVLGRAMHWSEGKADEKVAESGDPADMHDIFTPNVMDTVPNAGL